MALSRRLFALLSVLLGIAAGAPRPPLAVDPEKALGAAGAPVTLEIFSSFDCPHCRDLHQRVVPLIVAHYVVRGKVYLVSHESPMRPLSRQAAIYATAAARIGKYQAVCDALYQGQAAWTASGQVWSVVASVLNRTEQQTVVMLAGTPGVIAEVDRDRQFSERLPSLPAMIVTSGTQSTLINGLPDPSLLRRFLDTLVP